jgi:DNA-binding cell septation regulator SpoVG
MTEISKIRVFALKKPHPKIAANGDFVVDNAFKVKFTLFKGKEGMFVGLPGKLGEPDKDGKKPWYSDVMFVNDEIRNKLTELVVSEYNKHTGNKSQNKMDQGEAAGPTNQDTDDGIPF